MSMTEQSDSKPTTRVLVVDDDPVQGAIVSGVCNRLGHRSTYVSCYQAAADQVAAGGFDYITIDLSLGDRDGIELLRLIATQRRVPKIIVISGCDQRILNASVRMAHAAGIVDAVSLQKPINLPALRAALTFHGSDHVSAPGKPRAPIGQIAAADLEKAFDAGEFYAAFQPKIDLSTGRVIGCEALARWDSPSFGAVSPELFVPLAEQCGIIKPLTVRMLRDSMSMVKTLLAIDPKFVVAVNLSASLLSDTAIPEEIERLLEETGAPARSLMIEVTESTAMADVARAMDILLRLRIKGVGISIDDFGTGYSSLSALARMPFSELKIDRSFVQDCLSDADMWKVVSSSVAIAHQYNMKAVAEGIEDDDTWQVLAGLGCDIGQGYEFSPALRQDAFVEWCRAWNRRVHTPSGADRMIVRGA
jgi:EAL domain-containing protein (putative c-di-GMP-specific phosphodiesterase class I)/ActR/RegA family two-component response regulator